MSSACLKLGLRHIEQTSQSRLVGITFSGGVCMFVKKSLRARVFAKSNKPNSIEYIFVELFLPSSKCLVATIYKMDYA